MTDRTTQRNRILDLLSSGNWVTLPELLDLRIANYRARLSELRKRGMDIECQTEWVGRVRRSRYRLITAQERG